MSAARLEETAAFPFIEVSGTPRNVGLQYGRKAAGRIHRSIEIYRRTFAEKGVEWTLARATAARFAVRIEQSLSPYRRRDARPGRGCRSPL